MSYQPDNKQLQIFFLKKKVSLLLDVKETEKGNQRVQTLETADQVPPTWQVRVGEPEYPVLQVPETDWPWAIVWAQVAFPEVESAAQ